MSLPSPQADLTFIPVHTLLAGSALSNARILDRLLEAGCGEVRVTGSQGQLADSLREWPEALVVIGGDRLALRPYLHRAVQAGASVLVLLEGVPLESSGEALIAAGARGALRDDIPAPGLAAALAAVRCGLIVLDPALASSPQALVAATDPADAERPVTQALTRREQQVLSLIAIGASNKGIARRLGVSSNTVKFHLASLFSKLHVTTRAEAVAEAIRRGQLSL